MITNTRVLRVWQLYKPLTWDFGKLQHGWVNSQNQQNAPLSRLCANISDVIELHWMWIIISQLLDPAKWRQWLSLIGGAWSEKAANRVKRLNRKKIFRDSWMAMSGCHLRCACTSRNLREPVESCLLTTSCWIGAKRYEMSGGRQKEGLRGGTILQCSRH